MSEPTPSARVQLAHGDAWQELGRIHAVHGGGTARLPGVRLMSSGLPQPEWNAADVDDPAVVDVAAVSRWYAERDVPWGVLVPAGSEWPHGRRLFRMRLMSLLAGSSAPGRLPEGIALRTARPADLDGVLAVDGEAFGTSPEAGRPWLEPLLSASAAVVVAAYDGDSVVGTGYALVTDGEAGRTVYVAGIAVRPTARRRGIGAAMSSWLVERGFAGGADLAHLHPDTDAAASIYRRLGFVEGDGFDVYVDIA